MLSTAVTGTLVSDIPHDEIDFHYAGASTTPDTATYILGGQTQCVVTFTYDGSSRLTKMKRTNH